MKFLVQQGILLDFIFALQKAKEWWDWWKPEEKIIEFVDSGCSKEICPVGSLEFCLDYYKKLGITLEPINVPENLFNYSIQAGNGSRKIPSFPDWLKELEKAAIGRGKSKNYYLDFVWKNGFYLKSETKFKYPGNGVYETIKDFVESEYYDPSDRYQLTSIDPRLSDEWRYFVFEGKVVGCKCYLPDDIMSPIIPNKDWVLDKVKKIDLPAFTLDIATTRHSITTCWRIVEVHDFFSCGLYGFDDYKILPYMLYRSHLHKFL